MKNNQAVLMFHLTKKNPSGQHKAEKDICFIGITYKYTNSYSVNLYGTGI